MSALKSFMMILYGILFYPLGRGFMMVYIITFLSIFENKETAARIKFANNRKTIYRYGKAERLKSYGVLMEVY